MKLQVIDRRLVKRILARWQEIADEGQFPRRSQIGPHVFGEDWAHCFIVDLDPTLNRSRLSFIGETIRDPAWPSGVEQRVADCQDGTLLKFAVTRIPALLKRRAPINFGGYEVHGEGHIVYRSILLPLAEDGKTIDGVLAAISHREAAADRGLHGENLAVAV
jgi:hypothetical protein